MITIEKDGLRFILPAAVLGLGLLFCFWPAGVALLLLALALTLFFRETVRSVEFAARQVVSPASGRVIEIYETAEPEFIQGAARRISIFMSVLDEHINYAPVGGVVDYLARQEGGFRRAYLGTSSESNEAQKIGFRAGPIPVLMKQVAGVLARRIVCRCRLGERMRAGQKLGLIRLGSRVDLFLPLSVELKVSLGQKVTGGLTVIGEMR